MFVFQYSQLCNGMMVTCSKDRSIAVWDMVSPTEINLRRVLVGHRYCTVLYCALYCIVLYCTVLYCTIQSTDVAWRDWILIVPEIVPVVTSLTVLLLGNQHLKTVKVEICIGLYYKSLLLIIDSSIRK